MSRKCEYAVYTSGWFLAVALYVLQACFLTKFLGDNSQLSNGNLWWIASIFYFVCACVFCFIIARKLKGVARDDREFRYVWGMWLVYIIPNAVFVGLIFALGGDQLEKSDTFGPNFLKSTVCITPGLLVVFLNLTISHSYRKGVLSLSVFGALNLFDGIEMLEIVLMQKEHEDFELEETVELPIIVLACVSFVVTSIGLARFKLDGGETVEERANCMAVSYGLIEVLVTNVPFLALRIYVWVDSGYEASIFIAKNIISLVVGFVDFFIACGS